MLHVKTFKFKFEFEKRKFCVFKKSKRQNEIYTLLKNTYFITGVEISVFRYNVELKIVLGSPTIGVKYVVLPCLSGT